jgi:hypothetical protein
MRTWEDTRCETDSHVQLGSYSFCVNYPLQEHIFRFFDHQLLAKSEHYDSMTCGARSRPGRRQVFRPAELYSVTTIARHSIARNRLVAESAI